MNPILPPTFESYATTSAEFVDDSNQSSNNQATFNQRQVNTVDSSETFLPSSSIGDDFNVAVAELLAMNNNEIFVDFSTEPSDTSDELFEDCMNENLWNEINQSSEGGHLGEEVSNKLDNSHTVQKEATRTNDAIDCLPNFTFQMDDKEKSVINTTTQQEVILIKDADSLSHSSIQLGVDHNSEQRNRVVDTLDASSKTINNRNKGVKRNLKSNLPKESILVSQRLNLIESTLHNQSTMISVLVNANNQLSVNCTTLSNELDEQKKYSANLLKRCNDFDNSMLNRDIKLNDFRNQLNQKDKKIENQKARINLLENRMDAYQKDLQKELFSVATMINAPVEKRKRFSTTLPQTSESKRLKGENSHTTSMTSLQSSSTNAVDSKKTVDNRSALLNQLPLMNRHASDTPNQLLASILKNSTGLPNMLDKK